MKKMLLNLCGLLIAVFCTTSLWAQNTVQTVSQVTDGVVLTDAVDFVITGETPITTSGSVNLQNADAVIIFQNVRPATVKSSYLSRVRINGSRATSGSNCWVEIYKNGTIIYPHPETNFKPLTVFTEKDFGGESYNNFTPYTKYTSGEWVDNIQCIQLKRGYMATLATNSNGQGWSKVFIAQDADLSIDFSKVNYGHFIAGKAGFIRVFPWRNVTKKGTGGSPGNRHRELNTTWMYGWNGDGFHDDYIEHIPQHHHEGWPSWDGINNLNTCNTVLGNNEPDNQGDDREEYIPVDVMEERLFGTSGSWQNQAYTGGLRIGSPAMSGDARGGWLSRFMELAEQYNCRIDFIADHCYWHDPASSFNWQMNTTYDKYHRPIWITEFNYGANWTAWESSDHSGSDANQTIELNAISSIVTALENNTHVERYAFYNWVEDCRALVFDKVTRDSQGNVISTETILTKTFYWYRDLKSNSAYDPINEFTMGWNYKEPTNLKANYSTTSKVATLSWNHLNGKQTDSVHIERKVGSSQWTKVASLYRPSNNFLTYQDDLNGIKGLVKYRIADFDSDKKTRRTGEVLITIASGNGSEFLQFNSITLPDLNEKIVPFDVEMTSTPAVFFGLPTYNNANLVLEPYIKYTYITTTEFKFKPISWRKQARTGEFKNNEKLPFMAILPGNYHYDGMDIEVNTITIKSDTIDVVFNEPFPEGVIPVVIMSPNSTTDTVRPLMHKIWNITNTGFRCVVMYEDGEINARGNHIVPSVNQYVSYIACTPGDVLVDEDAGTYLAAGFGQNEVIGTSPSTQYFLLQVGETDEGEAINDTLRLVDPVIFCDTQTKNLPTPSVLRQRGNVTEKATDPDTGEQITYTTGFKVRRIVDESVTSGLNNLDSGTGDQVGWIALHTNQASTPTGVRQPVIEGVYSGDELNVRVKNRIIYVEGHKQFELFTAKGTRAASNATQVPGVYIVRAGGKTAKIVVK